MPEPAAAGCYAVTLASRGHAFLTSRAEALGGSTESRADEDRGPLPAAVFVVLREEKLLNLVNAL